ncbi:MAG: hypothetical protein JNN12_02455 [Bacteroidetes Order II. Incertae sedis bacterium]|nr:hypothetical protein [Bacteroidetes Order II. bacterium]
MKRYLRLLGLVWSCSLLVTNAQVETRFEHATNRYRWQADVNLRQAFPKGYFLLRNRFASEALVLGNTTAWRDENLTFFQLNRSLSPYVETVLLNRTALFSQNNVWSQEVLAGVQYQKNATWRVLPLMGFAWDRRQGIPDLQGIPILRLDSGPALGFRFEAVPVLEEGSTLNVSGEADYQKIQPRQNHGISVRTGFSRQKGAQAFQVRAKFATLRRDTYQEAVFQQQTPDVRGEMIEAILSDTLEAGLNFQTPISKHLAFIGSADFAANNRRIRIIQHPEEALSPNTNLNRQRLNGEVGVAYHQRNVRLRLAAQWGAEAEARRLAVGFNLPASWGEQLRKTNFERGTFALNTQIHLPVTSRLQLQANGASSILRHDTPETNPDDRDEVFHNGELRLVWQVAPSLMAQFQVLGTYYHTVYLKADRSIENNIQHSLRWRPTIRWLPADQTRITFSPEVRATYTVDDFELAGRLKNDQSARELRFDTTIEHRWSDESRLSLASDFSDLRLGRLLWAAFAEIPFDTVQTYSGWARYRVGTTWTAEVGVRLFLRQDYNQNLTLYYDQWDGNGEPTLGADGKPIRKALSGAGWEVIRQLGPTTAVVFPLGKGSSLHAEGWLQYQNIRQQFHQTLPDIPEVLHAARKGRTQLFPHISIGVLWRW